MDNGQEWDRELTIHKLDVTIYHDFQSIWTIPSSYKAHIYQLRDRLVARRNGVLRVVEHKIGYGHHVEVEWIETDEIMEVDVDSH